MVAQANWDITSLTKNKFRGNSISSPTKKKKLASTEIKNTLRRVSYLTALSAWSLKKAKASVEDPSQWLRNCHQLADWCRIQTNKNKTKEECHIFLLLRRMTRECQPNPSNPVKVLIKAKMTREATIQKWKSENRAQQTLYHISMTTLQLKKKIINQ